MNKKVIFGIALRSALIYFAFSTVWILTTDEIVLALFRTPEVLTFVQHIKGMLFITLSAILIYILIYIQVKRRAVIDELYDKTGSRMRLIYDSAPIGIVLIKNRRLIEANKFFCEMLGYNESELIGRTTRHLYRTQAEFERVGAYYRGLENSAVPVVFETTHIRKNGEEVNIVITLVALNPVNLGEGVIGIVNDITSLKRFGTQFEEEQTRFTNVVQSLPMGILFFKVVDDNLIFQGANPASDRILKIDHAQHIGKTITEVYPALADTDLPARYYEAAVKGVSFQIDEQYYNDDNISGAYEVFAFQTVQGSMAVMFADISDRILARENLKKQKELIESVMATSPVAILVVDINGDAIFSNPASDIIFGQNADDMKNLKFRNQAFLSIDGDLESRGELPFQIIKNTLQPIKDARYAYRLPDGSLNYLSVNCAPLIDENGFKGAIYAIEDITKRILNEQQKLKLEEQLVKSRRLESIAQLAGGVAHDFNNLLTPIIGYADFLLDLKDTFKDSSNNLIVGDILEAAQKAKALTQQLLAFGRKQALDIHSLNLNDTITSLKKLLRSTVRENIKIEYFCEPELKNINADKSQMEQILLNLVLNAQDALPDGGSIIIETKNTELGEEYIAMHMEVIAGAYAELVVSDNGTGMDEDNLRKIFEPFFTTKGAGKGTGLGLATVHGIVKQHNGNIMVYSEKGRGTTFKVYLPVNTAAEEVVYEPLAAASEPRTGSGRILVVEDNDTIRNMLDKVLLKMGFEIAVADDENHAIEIASEAGRIFDLLLTDVIMPTMNGVELYNAIKPRHPDMKVLYMSGYTDNVIAHNGILEPNVNFIQKPFSINDLFEKISSILNIK